MTIQALTGSEDGVRRIGLAEWCEMEAAGRAGGPFYVKYTNDNYLELRTVDNKPVVISVEADLVEGVI